VLGFELAQKRAFAHASTGSQGAYGESLRDDI
jgi:hypothetical protein